MTKHGIPPAIAKRMQDLASLVNNALRHIKELVAGFLSWYLRKSPLRSSRCLPLILPRCDSPPNELSLFVKAIRATKRTRTIAPDIAKRMQDAAPVINNALGQIEAYLAPHGFSPYGRDSRARYHHDLCLMSAHDDLSSISVGLLDRADHLLASHMVHLSIAADTGGPAIPQQLQQPSIPIKGLTHHTGIQVHCHGKDHQYARWLKIDWSLSHAKQPDVLTRSLAFASPRHQQLGTPYPATLPAPSTPRRRLPKP